MVVVCDICKKRKYPLLVLGNKMVCSDCLIEDARKSGLKTVKSDPERIIPKIDMEGNIKK